MQLLGPQEIAKKRREEMCGGLEVIKQQGDELPEDETREKGLLHLLRLITRENIHSSTLDKFKDILGRLKEFSLQLLEQLWAQHKSLAEMNFAREFFQDTLEHIVYQSEKFTVEEDGLWISRLFLLIYTQKLEERVRLATGVIKAWSTWVLGEGRDDTDTVRPVLLKVSLQFLL